MSSGIAPPVPSPRSMLKRLAVSVALTAAEALPTFAGGRRGAVANPRRSLPSSLASLGGEVSEGCPNNILPFAGKTATFVAVTTATFGPWALERRVFSSAGLTGRAFVG